MGAIQGIKARVVVGNAGNDGTSNRLFLGIHDTSSPIGTGAGGREFPLWTEGTKGLTQGSETTFALGSPCCPDPKQVQVYDSGSTSGVNHPTHNPIELQNVRFVYLRKAAGTTVDDSLVLEDVEVLLCDGSTAGMRRFRNNRNLYFGQLWGEQHWLKEVAPPHCQVTITLANVEQWGIGKNNDPAGRNWHLALAGFSGGQYASTSQFDFKSSFSGRKHWHEVVGYGAQLTLPGCCGGSQSIHLEANASEYDILGSTDYGQGTTDLEIACTSAGSRKSGSITFEVAGNLKARKSKLTFNYEVSAICIS